MEQIFLEPNEEITSVIDKLSSASSGKVAVVVPKNSTMFQSLVNLKLLAKQAKELNREVVLITTNKVGQRLAAQVGIETYATVGTVRPASQTPVTAAPQASVAPAAEPETLPDGTPVRRYVPPIPNGTPPPVATTSEAEEVVEKPDANPIVDVAQPNDLPTEAVTVEAHQSPDPPVEAVPKPEPAAERMNDLPPIISRGVATRQEFHFQLPWKSLLAAAVLLLITFTLVYIMVPKATVTVTLPAKAVSETIDVAVRTVADQSDNSITGNLLTVEKSLTKPVAATGKKDIGTKATGTLAFRNCEDTSTHPVAAGSKVTSAGKTFLTNAAVTIPAGSFSGGGSVCNSASVNVAVSAEVAGEAHNIANGTFAITGLSTRISGTGTTTGGTTKQVTILTQADVDQGLAALEKQAAEESATELAAKAEGQTILAEAITQTIKTRTSDKKVGDQVEAATVTLVTTVATIAYDKVALEAKHREALTKKIDQGQKLEVPADKAPTTAFKSYSEDKSVLTLTLSGDGFGVPDISKQDLAAAVRHSTKAGAESKLKEAYGATEVKVEMSPAWWFDRLPILSGAITVEYGFSEVVPAVESVPEE